MINYAEIDPLVNETGIDPFFYLLAILVSCLGFLLGTFSNANREYRKRLGCPHCGSVMFLTKTPNGQSRYTAGCGYEEPETFKRGH